MKIRCVWEHNGGDTLLYAADLPGAYARGDSKETALEKMRREIPSFLRWAGCRRPAERRGAAQPRARRARTPGAPRGRPGASKPPQGALTGCAANACPCRRPAEKGKPCRTISVTCRHFVGQTRLTFPCGVCYNQIVFKITTMASLVASHCSWMLQRAGLCFFGYENFLMQEVPT